MRDLAFFPPLYSILGQFFPSLVQGLSVAILLVEVTSTSNCAVPVTVQKLYIYSTGVECNSFWMNSRVPLFKQTHSCSLTKIKLYLITHGKFKGTGWNVQVHILKRVGLRVKSYNYYWDSCPLPPSSLRWFVNKKACTVRPQHSALMSLRADFICSWKHIHAKSPSTVGIKMMRDFHHFLWSDIL